MVLEDEALGRASYHWEDGSEFLSLFISGKSATLLREIDAPHFKVVVGETRFEFGQEFLVDLINARRRFMVDINGFITERRGKTRNVNLWGDSSEDKIPEGGANPTADRASLDCEAPVVDGSLHFLQNSFIRPIPDQGLIRGRAAFVVLGNQKIPLVTRI